VSATCCVGDATIRKAMFALQSVMGLAVLHGRVATNSVKAVRKPRQRSRRVRPLAPITVETIRTSLGLRDATLVSVLAYAGLRPGEALGLQWQNVRDRTLLVDRSVSLGREKAPRPTPPAPFGWYRRSWRISASGCADATTSPPPRPRGSRKRGPTTFATCSFRY
jgi:integrase